MLRPLVLASAAAVLATSPASAQIAMQQPPVGLSAPKCGQVQPPAVDPGRALAGKLIVLIGSDVIGQTVVISNSGLRIEETKADDEEPSVAVFRTTSPGHKSVGELKLAGEMTTDRASLMAWIAETRCSASVRITPDDQPSEPSP